jgi:hypothetical protein
MVDFAKLLENSRKRVHRIHVLYRCNSCGKEQWYLSEAISESIANSERYYYEGARCRGRFKLVKRRAVLRVWCHHKEEKRLQRESGEQT